MTRKEQIGCASEKTNRQILGALSDNWQPLLRILLYDSQQPLTRAKAWYLNQTCSGYNESPSWPSLLRVLLSEDAFIQGSTLVFVERIFHLPLTVQDLILQFLLKFKEEIDIPDLSQTLDAYEAHNIEQSERNNSNVFKNKQVYFAARKEENVHDDEDDNSDDDCKIYKKSDDIAILDEDSNSKHENTEFQRIVLSNTEVSGLNNSNLIEDDDGMDGEEVMALRNAMNEKLNELDQFVKEAIFKETLAEDDYEWLAASQDDMHAFDDVIDTPRMSQLSPMSQKMSQMAMTHRTATRKRFLSPLQVTQGSPSLKRSRFDTLMLLESQYMSQSTGSDGQSDVITDDMKACIERIKCFWQGSEVGKASSEDLCIFCTASLVQVPELCSLLEIQEYSTEQLCRALSDMTSLVNQITFSNTAAFIQTAVLPKITVLDEKAGRDFLSGLSTFTKHFQKPMLDAVYRPCLTSIATGFEIGDLLLKLTKESFDEDNRRQLIRLCCEDGVGIGDVTISILHSLFDSKISIDDAISNRIISCLDNSSSVHADNLKFGKLILVFVNKYGKQLDREQLQRLQELVETQRYFLKKSILTAIKKMNT